MIKTGTVLVLIGPQGSGKGTQAALLADRDGFCVVGMSDLLRSEVANLTGLKEKITSEIQRGEFIDTDLSVHLIEQYLKRLPSGSKIIFDGFPRLVEQARELDNLVVVTKAVHIDVPYDVSLKRIAGRLMCPRGHVYNKYFVPPRRPGVCTVDELPLHGREDDTETVVKTRLALYQQVTTHVLAYYRAQGKLVSINGNQSVLAVAHEIREKVLAYV